MKTLKRRLSDQSGFTLVEIIVTLAILAIVLTIAGTVYFFGNRMYVDTEKKNTQKYIGDSVYSYIEKEMTYATALQIRKDRSNPTDSTSYPLYLANSTKSDVAGYLTRGTSGSSIDPENVLGSGFYGQYTVKYTVTVPNTGDDESTKNRVSLKVSVYDSDNNEVYTTESLIKNLNTTVLIYNGNQGVAYVNPVIAYSEGADESVDSAWASVLQLKNDYVSMYNYIKTHLPTEVAAKYPGYNSPTVDNSKISDWLLTNTYKGTWPVLPDQISSKDGFTYVNNFFNTSSHSTLYMRPYFPTTVSGANIDTDFYVFVSSQNLSSSGFTDYYFLYHPNDSTVYVSTNQFNKTLKGTDAVIDKTWSSVLSDVINISYSNWTLFEK